MMMFVKRHNICPHVYVQICLASAIVLIVYRCLSRSTVTRVTSGKLLFYNQTQYRMLPDNSVIDGMNEAELYLTFEKYITQNQVICDNVSRAGPYNTSGKNICTDDRNSLRKGCLVYSFGSKLDFHFETAVFKSYRCEIHTFDPSISIIGKTIPEGIQFHLTGLSDKDGIIPITRNISATTERIWEMRKLSSIRMSLHHWDRHIDILKIDIEGWEWPALPDMIQSGALRSVKQLCLEVHFGYSFDYFRDKKEFAFSNFTWGNTQILDQIKILKQLHDYGFRIFISEPTQGWALWTVKSPSKNIKTIVEVSLVNINFVDKSFHLST